ncbi:MAG TPA: tripartite tricarboxylate transporter substrate binding protein [Burkholderiaceae bacterium]
MPRHAAMLTIDRRRFLVAAVALASACHTGAQPAAFPSKPIKLLVGFAPGGAVDIIARALGQQIASALGQPIVVENKPGAGTNIALRALIDSPPDGYTLMLTANSIAANPALYQPPPFDMARDFTPVALVGRVPVVLAAGAQAPIESIAKLIELSKASARSVNYGSPGNGSTPHLAIELFQRAAGIQLNHVPYKGGAPALSDTIGGHLTLVAVNALEALPHARAGKLRVLAVLSATRSPIFPDVPSIAELGYPGFEAAVWYGVVAPAGLPAPVVARLHAEVQKALAAPEVRDRLAAAGGEVLPGPVERLASLMASERARYDKLIREARIQPD